MGLLGDLKDDVVGLVRDPTDEQKILVVAFAAMAVSDRYFYFNDIPFVVRTTAAVGVGFIVMFVVSYLYTGQLVPPDGNVGDDDEPEEYVDELDP
ncbi:hypothetical protein C463_11192 [Halorubrum californiense DSM 19288]|uniref:Uncharacterized protein n=1 Tax=Halorubrum californiense DSM 19288 TaxID=1227465 RepID=M0E5E4_9EURY|nr:MULTISPECIES: hypothetical protein [Halorubrum]ELZ42137.1 hypothetical protein C463_11192 [Halorubrum californiense DSM 19288]TKX70924.1 hypothetical protein EXE40_08485 [Halorubrum sp. GN11GM_10-3_MGM]